jgi:hypothetical protein
MRSRAGDRCFQPRILTVVVSSANLARFLACFILIGSRLALCRLPAARYAVVAKWAGLRLTRMSGITGANIVLLCHKTFTVGAFWAFVDAFRLVWTDFTWRASCTFCFLGETGNRAVVAWWAWNKSTSYAVMISGAFLGSLRC